MTGLWAKRMTAGLAALLAVAWVVPPTGAQAAQPKKKLLYFTKSSGFEHGAVKRKDGELSISEKILVEIGKKNGWEIVPTKDGSLISAENLKQYAGVITYATGDLTKAGNDKQPPMSAEGKAALLEAVSNGMAFIGIHAGNDAFRRPNSRTPDPWIAVLGAEFKTHGKQQKARNTVADKKFPGMEKLGDGFEMHEEWYVMRNLAPDMHVLLVQETEGMEGNQYNEPRYPATWARKEGKGRVFYTSLGHRDDVWESDTMEQILTGGIKWALGEVDADVSPNIKQVCPEALEKLGAEK
jgi:type 1 glutamine amidotransferase